MDWNLNSKYLVGLSVENEEKLKKLIELFEKKGLNYSIFTEPDINDEITAICVEGNDTSRKLLSNLPLMLKEYSKNKINKHSYSSINQ
jgi:hypothetical protein